MCNCGYCGWKVNEVDLEESVEDEDRKMTYFLI